MTIVAATVRHEIEQRPVMAAHDVTTIVPAIDAILPMGIETMAT
jgi:hypothetical protein